MTGLDILPRTDPTSILRYRDGIYAVDLLTAAITEFRLFDQIAAQPMTLAELCHYYGWAERPADVLVTLCKAAGYLWEGQGGLLQLTDVAREHLVEESPWNLSGYYASLRNRPVVADFVRVLASGKPAHWSGLDEAQDDWHKSMERTEFARTFTAAMDCRGVFLGKKLADAVAEWTTGGGRLLDIGGGSGVYACALAANAPDLRAVVLEQASVSDIAVDHIWKRGLSDRVSVMVGDMFGETWPLDCDLHLFSNVMHDWDLPVIRELLDHSRRTLLPGGHVIIHETFLWPDKTGPLPVAEYSCILAHSTQGRCYSVSEMQGLLRETGFTPVVHRDTGGDRGVIVGAI